MALQSPLILFYNKFFRRWPQTAALDCAKACRFTTDRAALAAADAVVFHLPSCEDIWAAPKYPGQLWIAASMESAASCRDLADPAFMGAFDLTMTFRRDSDVRTPYFSLAALPALHGPVPAKTEPAPAVLFQSAGFDSSGRYAYLRALMQHLKVDSYGRMLPTRGLDGLDLGRRTKLDTIARYKFCLCFENAIEPDYVTEKFYQALRVGCVPVYRGAPNIRDFAPDDGSYINADDFAGPAELAAYLNELDRDGAAYRRYHEWRERASSARFLDFIAATERPAFCRLCDLVSRRAEPAARGGLPTRPLAWRRWLRLADDGRHAPAAPE
jgi:Glycosyltransferase family 10 (fucosyltransferase) C-term/Fucosyltransferase, N-terminal